MSRWTKARGCAWVIVAGMALLLSWWSLFTLARGYGVPVLLAVGVSLVFDAAALICAGLAHRYALSPDSGAGPRVTLLGLLTGSAYLNWTHADLSGYGTPAAVMFAAPAAVAVVLFELETAWVNRAGLRERGRMAAPLPVLGRWAWLFHPGRAFRTVWLVTAAQADAVRAVELTHWHQMAAPVPTGPTTASTRPGQVDPTTPPPDTQRDDHPARSTDRATGHLDPAGPATAATVAEDQARRLLALMHSNAERVRFAAHQVGPTQAAVTAYLTACGVSINPEAVRTALRRHKATTNGAVVPIRAAGA
jgi:Protein of unknown function (DUF2637)